MNRYWLTHDRDGYWIVDMETHQWYSFGPDIEAATRERDRPLDESRAALIAHMIHKETTNETDRDSYRS